ncbi:MAG: hypothetical protein QF906_01340 [Dehalococcoidales bacterium]|jgi:hypothetical protein|nr:hypothetical protein [Dehalococcoidales bacterium]MDP6043200.1 hypothetical protein [Dehalococcoidales bacterium]MDP6576365.1 hypothetical protein [Dehalococcoidales bacterium]MDP6824558.1 hypothetical protein [Dehalococcoidales bacterium]MDP7285967.1 hypothetical protein [Dehalococcoidales bacterium]|tara:strand:- start:2112 stop:2333 length:222 start_codon:yes stop_codon:yes gene_type:complete
MDYKVEEKSAPGRNKVEVLGATFEAGKPEIGGEDGRWRQKLDTREEKLKYLQTGERYWYSKEWFGSEKRKNPA